MYAKAAITTTVDTPLSAGQRLWMDMVVGLGLFIGDIGKQSIDPDCLEVFKGFFWELAGGTTEHVQTRPAVMTIMDEMAGYADEWLSDLNSGDPLRFVSSNLSAATFLAAHKMAPHLTEGSPKVWSAAGERLLIGLCTILTGGGAKVKFKQEGNVDQGIYQGWIDIMADSVAMSNRVNAITGIYQLPFP